LVSPLDEEGAPASVFAATVAPPESQIGPLDDAARARIVTNSPMSGRYDKAVDRESAFERLAQRAEGAAQRAEVEEREKKQVRTRSPRRSNRQTPSEAFVKSTLRSIGRSLGSSLVRGILGALRR
jgi:hypothetical protein